jgi:uncharacterized protein
MRFRVKVHPRAKRSRLAGKLGEEWKLEITAPPVDGKANKAVIEFFAEALGVPRSSVRISAGEHSQHKVLEIPGVTEADIAGIEHST